MNTINTHAMGNSSILRINAEKDLINTAPEYQRHGLIWTLEKRQLLIDSILNDYDIPKIYFHVINDRLKKKFKSKYDYAIIDGRQRIETIWSFINGDFPLADDFSYFKDKYIRAGKLTYPQLASEYPKLKIIFDGFVLPIILVETDDIELIEDMFSRLNEAVPLNAAEKRNAIGGPMAKTIRYVADHPFFKKKISFTNKRFQHREVATRLLFIEYCLLYGNNKLIDTKKPYLDNFVRLYKNNKQLNAKELEDEVTFVLNLMMDVFSNRDQLLRSQANIPIYYLLFEDAYNSKAIKKITRRKLLKFKNDVSTNRQKAEEDIANSIFDLLEFDRLTQQGTNDASSIRERLRIIKEYFNIQ